MKNKKIILLSLITFIGLTAVGGLLHWHNRSETRNENLPTAQEDNFVDDKNQQLSDSRSPSNSTDKELSPSQAASSADTLEKPVITRAELSGDFVRISAMLSSSSTGTCVLEMKKAGQPTLTKSTGIIVGPSYYSCDGFKFSSSELSTNGEWTVTVAHTFNGRSSISDEKTVLVP